MTDRATPDYDAPLGSTENPIRVPVAGFVQRAVIPHHSGCVRNPDGTFVCDPLCPGPHGGERCGYVLPSGSDGGVS